MAGTKHRAQDIVLPIQLTLGIPVIRPKQKFLGLMVAMQNVYGCFFIGKTMTCDVTSH